MVAGDERQPALLLLLGAEQQQRLGDADRLVRGQQRRQRGVHRARQRQRAVVVDLREPEPAVLLGHLHAERAELLEPVDHGVGDAGVALDRQRVDVLDQERPQALEEPLAALDRLGVELRLGMDQVEPQAAEEEVLAEARQLPLALAGLLGDLTGFTFGDLASPCMPVTPAAERSRPSGRPALSQISGWSSGTKERSPPGSRLTSGVAARQVDDEVHRLRVVHERDPVDRAEGVRARSRWIGAVPRVRRHAAGSRPSPHRCRPHVGRSRRRSGCSGRPRS